MIINNFKSAINTAFKASDIKKFNSHVSAPDSKDSDTFIKQNDNSFQLKTYEDLENLFYNHGLADKIKDALTKGKILGEGFEGIVYAIPGNDDFVVKEYKRSHLIREHLDHPEIKEIKNVPYEINCGQSIAVADIPYNNVYERVSILKKQSGQPLGVNFRYCGDVCEYNTKKHIESLRKIAEAEGKTFKFLIRDIQFVSDSMFAFDYNNSNNFLYDEEKSEIRFVDIDDRLSEENKQFAEVLFALLDCNYAVSLNNSDDDAAKKIAKDLSVKIQKKFFDAMKISDVKFTDSEALNRLLETDILDIPGSSIEAKKDYLKQEQLF